MKNTRLLLGITFAAFGSLCSFTLFKMSGNTPLYKVRENKMPKGIAGAIQWYFDNKKNPVTNTIDPADVYSTLHEVKNRPMNKSAALNLNWQELGPDNVGGRTRAILIDKNNSNRIYAGGVAGGLWVSNDGAATWSLYSGYLENIAVTCITQASNGDIYFGTGEGLYPPTGYASSGVIGGGVWKSTDGGVTFNRLAETVPVPNSSGGTPWYCVNQMKAHPTNPNRIYAATSYGLMMTNDGGNHWFVPIRSISGMAVNSLTQDVDVFSDGAVLVSSAGNLYYSANGDSGTFALKSFPASGSNRIEIAIAPTDDNYVYAAASKASDSKVLGIYQSVDKGTNWTLIGPGGSATFTPFGSSQGQGSYDNTVAVSPADKGKIILGGVELWSWEQLSPSTPGVGQWNKIAYETEGYIILNKYVHADKHTTVFHPTNANIVYLGTDGGVFKSIDGGQTWNPMNKGYNVTQFYSIAYESNGANGTGVMGGTQDNSTPYISGTGNTVQWADVLNGGDGGDVEISFLNPKAFFMESQYANLVRSSNKGATPANFYSARITASNPTASFIAPFALYENNDATNSVDSLLFVASKELKVIQGNGTAVYTGTLSPLQSSASIVPDSVTIKSGTLTLVDDGSGNLTGSGSGTITHATGAYSFTLSSAVSSVLPISFEYDVMYNPGSVVNVRSNTSNYMYKHTFTSTVNPRDSVWIQDKVVARFAIGFSGSHGVWMTKEALDFSKTPEWFKLGTINGSAESMAWSPDGDILYVGSSSGELYRFSNLASVKDSVTGDVTSAQTVVVKTQIADFPRIVTGVNVDPNNSERVIVAIGGYYGATASSNVWYSSTAASCGSSTGTANFTGVQGTGANKLPSMPAYDAIFEMNNPNTVIVATEYGVYATDDITQPAASIAWTEENGGVGMMRVPTFRIRQQTRPWWNVNNSGVIYIGTHGRGAWKAEKYMVTTGIGNNNSSAAKSTNKPAVKVYPNPLNGVGYVNFDLQTSSVVTIRVFDLQGKQVQLYTPGRLLEGKQNIEINSDGLPTGTYFVSVETEGGVTASTKFIITN